MGHQAATEVPHAHDDDQRCRRRGAVAEHGVLRQHGVGAAVEDAEELEPKAGVLGLELAGLQKLPKLGIGDVRGAGERTCAAATILLGQGLGGEGHVDVGAVGSADGDDVGGASRAGRLEYGRVAGVAGDDDHAFVTAALDGAVVGIDLDGHDRVPQLQEPARQQEAFAAEATDDHVAADAPQAQALQRLGEQHDDRRKARVADHERQSVPRDVELPRRRVLQAT